MCRLRNVKEVLWIFTPLLIKFASDIKIASSSLRAPFVDKFCLYRIGKLNQIDTF